MMLPPQRFTFILHNLFRSTRVLHTKRLHSCNKHSSCEFPARVSSHLLDIKYRTFISSAWTCKKNDRRPVVYKKKKPKRLAQLRKNMTVAELAEELDKTTDQIFEGMLYVEGTEEFDHENAKIYKFKVLQDIAKLFKVRYSFVAEHKIEEKPKSDVKRRPPPDEKDLVPRSPVVTIMGHVDHGKTTLLDHLRKSSIVDSEFGGITQHIGAFEVSLPSGGKVTFLDTPGHAAFSAMRARGATMTDIIVLVVAAEDGVMPQTKEVIDLANEADIPMIVAINKIDVPNANIKKTKDSLLEAGVQLESLGGEVQSVEISALKGINIDSLIEALVAQADVMNLRGDPKGLVEGYIIESRVDPVRGKVATCLVDRGTLQKGDVLVSGCTHAKVRSMMDERGSSLNEAGPSSAVQILGFKEVPNVGDEFLEVSSESQAKKIVDWRRSQQLNSKILEDLPAIEARQTEHMSAYVKERDERRALGYRFKAKGKPTKKEEIVKDTRLTIILKGDVSGSVEAIMDVLQTYDDDEQILLDIAGFGVGPPGEEELIHLQSFNGILYTFNLKLSPQIRNRAKQLGVQIREHNVIYHLVDELKKDISNAIPEKIVDKVEGEGHVEEEFVITVEKKKRPVAGCSITKGVVKINSLLKVIRENEIIYDGPIKSMRHHKNEVSSIQASSQCGIQVKDPEIRFEPDDVLLSYNKVPTKGETRWCPEGF